MSCNLSIESYLVIRGDSELKCPQHSATQIVVNHLCQKTDISGRSTDYRFSDCLLYRC